MQNLFHMRSRVEIETRRRIMLAVWAYAYEFENVSLVSDHHYDAESRLVDRSISTTRPDLDRFFQLDDMGGFQPNTGMWIRYHPELNKVKQLYERFFNDTRNG